MATTKKRSRRSNRKGPARHGTKPVSNERYQGTEGQDRKHYTGSQDRKHYGNARSSRDVDAELSKLFEKLGYEANYDGRVSTGERWHEVYDDGRLVLQVDFGVSPADFLKDLPFLAKGKSRPGSKDYTINTEPGRQGDADLREMLRRAKDRRA